MIFFHKRAKDNSCATVTVVGTSHKTRGGITSVINAHKSGSQWNEFHCKWIETHIDKDPFSKILYFIRGLIAFIIRLPKTDLVHIHLAAVERKMPFVFLTKLFRKKLIIHLHFPDPNTTIYDSKKSRRYIWCLKKADKVIVLSHTWKDLIAKIWDIDNTQVIYNPCPQIHPAPIYVSRENPYILYAGNLSDRKGYKDLLKAFASVANQMKEWRIVFAGNGDIEKAKFLAKELNIEKKVEFLGWVSGEGKDKCFRNASAYCLPSYAEGFPMGVLDAWAYHLPVITTPVGGLPDIIDDNKNALIFKAGDINGLAEKLLSLRQYDMRLKLSRESQILSETTFDIGNINRQVAGLYSKLLKNK